MKRQLLNTIVQNLDLIPQKGGPISQKDIDALGFAKARFTPIGIVGVKRSGGEALVDFAAAIFESSPDYKRGIVFKDLFDRVFVAILELFLECRQKATTEADVSLVESVIAEWFQQNSGRHYLYFPCRLSPWLAPEFKIGPVTFTHEIEFKQQKISEGVDIDQSDFKFLLQDMSKKNAAWIATVEINNCSKKRAWELGSLAVDIAITAIQLIAPLHATLNMSRATARTAPNTVYTLSCSSGELTHTDTDNSPGLTIGAGAMEKYLADGKNVVDSVGRRISAFLGERFVHLPTLEQAWADAAFWFHEGLAEPLDTIAVPKLETAIEVLLRAESARGSKARLIRAIEVFHGIGKDDLINPHSQLTVTKFAEGFVTDRSRILHGTWSTLVQGLHGSREPLTALTLGLLILYVLKLDEYDQSAAPTDDIAEFLTFAERRTQN